VALIVAVNVHRIVLSYVFEVPGSYVYSAFDTRIDHLLIGCLLAVVLHRRLFQSFWAAACSHPVAPLLTMGLLLLSIFVAPPYVLRYRHVVGYAVEPVLIAIFLVQAVALSRTIAWSWLDTAPMRFLGRISYSLYLYQQLTLYPVRRLLEGYSVWVQLPVALVVTVVVATFSYYCVERPFLQWKHRAPARRQPLEEPAVAL
jgi:peptidoglycan/LPS O-acetylase OafA/YrhL